MRKRTIKSIFSDIFWHVVYFFPIVAGLICMLLFTTDSYADYLTGKQNNIVTWLNVGDTLQFNERLTGFVEIYEMIQNDTYEKNSSLDVPYSYRLDTRVQEDYHIYVQLLSYSDTSFAMEFILFDSVYLYDSSAPHKSGWLYGTNQWNDHQITIIGEIKQYNEVMFDFLLKNTTLVDTEGAGSVAELLYDSFNSVFDVVGYNWTNDLVYKTLDDIFGLAGVFPVFRANSVIIKFLCYYFYVNVLHLFIDFILFIPRLCHRLLDNVNKGE